MDKYDKFFLLGEDEAAADIETLNLETSTLHDPRLIIRTAKGRVFNVPYNQTVLIREKPPEPTRWAIPEGAPPHQCRSCQGIIYWIEMKGGKKMPVNPDGISHFATCPDADTWRKEGKGSP